MFKYKIFINMIFVITWRAESSWSGSYERRVSKRKSRDNNHPELHPGQFDLLRNASPSQAPTWSRGTFSPYAFVSLRTRLPTHLSPYALVLPLRLCTSRKNIPLRYLSEIVHLSRHAVVILDRHSKWRGVELSVRRNRPPPLCGSQPRHQYWSE